MDGLGLSFGISDAFSNHNASVIVFRDRVIGYGVTGWIWGSWRSFPTFVILWLYLGPQSVCTVGWVGLDLGILEVFSNLCDSVVLFRATVSGHGGMGWG